MNNEDVSFSLQSGTSRKKKMLVPRKLMKLTVLRYVFGCPEFLLPSTLIKQGKFYVLQEKQLHKS